MKIAVASQNKSSVTSHAGKCQKFWVYEVNSQEILGKKLLELPKEQSFHNFHENPSNTIHPLDDIQVLIAGGMGKGLKHRLQAKQIETFVTEESEPDIAINAYLDGSLVRKTSESCECQEEGEHRHNHNHRHRHAHQ